MPEIPASESEDIAPLLRLGLEEEPDATIMVTAPSPRTGSSEQRAGSGGWNPPSVEELQQVLPQYEISGFIARGGMGAVYKGMQVTLKRAVAIKVLPPEIEDGDRQFAARFKHEAEAMARLSHPNIVAVFDAGQTPGGLLYFVMEFIDGTDVAQLIATTGSLEPLRAIQITTAVCEALAFAHEEGIIHRDIKPSNIMIDKRGRVKVADFGLAKTVSLEAPLLTGSNVAMGTPDFIAPEAMIPGMKVDQRADIYAVGVMLYQMLTGTIPRGRFELPSGVIPAMGKGFDAVVDKAMQTDRDKRYSTATEMKTAVEKVPTARNGTGPAPEPTPAGLGKSRSMKSRPLFAAAVIVLGAGGFFVFKKQEPSGPFNTLNEQSEARAAPTPQGIAESPRTAELKSAQIADSPKSPIPNTYVEGEKWERMWNEQSEFTERKTVAVENGWLVNKENSSVGSTLAYPKQWRDSGIRSEWRWATGSKHSHFSVRQWIGDRYQLSRSDTAIRLMYKSAAEEKVLKDYPIAEPEIGDTFTLELRAIGTTLIAKLDGKEIIRVEDAQLAAGGPALYLYGTAAMRNIELLNLDAGEGRAIIPSSPPIPKK